MFWTLLLAHLTADYPLQTDRLVIAKKQLPGLTVHVAIHLAVMILLFIPIIGIVWPFLLTVAIMHFAIDAFKNFLSNRRPKWVIGSYVLDQILHIGSLIVVSMWMAQTLELPAWQVTFPAVVYAIGLLLSTYIWFVTERILEYRYDYRQLSVNSSMWPRMGARLLLYAVAVAPLTNIWLLLVVAVIIIALLYRRYYYPRIWLFADVTVAVGSALLVRAILLFS